MTSKAKTTSQISQVLASMSLADALTALHDLDRDYAVTPDTARQDLASALAEVLAAAGRNGITTVTELIEGQAHLLQNLTGLTNPTAFHKTENAEQLHRYRNVITALAAAAAHSFGADTKPIWASALRLKSRTCHRARPLRDDEILLARVHAAIECAHKPSSQRAGIYAMTEAGMAPGETTGVALDSFDEPHDPQMVLAAGNGHLAARQLPMDHFAQALLGRLTRDAHKRNKPSSQPLTYAARKAQPSVNAKTASAQGVLDRMLVELGLNNSDITASSITQWRIHNVYMNADVQLAQQISGRTTIKQMEDILFESQPPRTVEGNSRRMDLLGYRLERDLPLIAEGCTEARMSSAQRQRVGRGFADMLLRGRHVEQELALVLTGVSETRYVSPPYGYGCPDYPRLHDRLSITEEVLVAWNFQEVAAEVVLEELHTACEVLLEQLVNKTSMWLAFAQLVATAKATGVLVRREGSMPPEDLLLALKDLRKDVRHRAAQGARPWLDDHWEEVAILIERLVTHLNRQGPGRAPAPWGSAPAAGAGSP